MTVRSSFSNTMLLLIILCIFFITCNKPTKPEEKEPPETLWTKIFGGIGWDHGRSVKQTSDEGYIIVGDAGSYGIGGSNDVWLIKTDTSGDTLWTRTFGKNGNNEVGFSVQQTTDEGYIITGCTDYYYDSDDIDVWLIKTDSTGDTLWTKTYGGGQNEVGNSVQQTSDGGYIITGWTMSWGAGLTDIWLIKTDSTGDTLWTKTFGGIELEEGTSVQQTSDEGYVVTGMTTSYGAGFGDVWLIKTDALGDKLWIKTFGSSGIDWGNSVQQTYDDGYIITGHTSSFGTGDFDVWLIKTDSSGDTLWTKTFGGSKYDRSLSVQQTSDEGYIITGYTSSFGTGDFDVWLIKTDASGNEVWTKTFGGNGNDRGYSIRQTSDEGYIIVGQTGSYDEGDSDVLLIRIAPE